jgi:hypothetical protein
MCLRAPKLENIAKRRCHRNVASQNDVDTKVDGGLAKCWFSCYLMTKESSAASPDFFIIVSAVY